MYVVFIICFYFNLIYSNFVVLSFDNIFIKKYQLKLRKNLIEKLHVSQII